MFNSAFSILSTSRSQPGVVTGCTNTNFTSMPEISCPNYQHDRCWDYGNPSADPASCHIGPNNPWNESMPLFGNRSIIAQPVDLWTLTESYVDFGIDFVQSATAKGDKPWFLYQAFNHMHVPVTSASAFFNTSTSRNKLEHGHVYGDALRELDHHIGRILDQLDTMGVRNNTLIFFTGDNGGT
jgi:hypothetical protein